MWTFSKRIKVILWNSLFVLAGGVLIYSAFRNTSFEAIKQVLYTGNYVVVIPVFIVSVTGYIFRISRWQLMLKNLEQPVDKPTLFHALCMGYAVSFVVPRLGELSRCILLRKTHTVPIEKGLISIIFERIADTLVLFFLLFVVVILFANAIRTFIYSYLFLPLQERLGQWAGLSLGMVAVVLVLIVIAVFFINKKSPFVKYLGWIRQLSLLLNVRRFWVYTVCIWICYFLMTYLWFYTFDFSEGLTMSDAFFLMVIGSIGRSVPVQGGGLGAYHFLIGHAGLLLGLTLVQGNALAVVIHGVQSVFTMILGLLSYLWFIFRMK